MTTGARHDTNSGSDDTSTVYSGAIGGSGGLVKTGTGILNLTGATYTAGPPSATVRCVSDLARPPASVVGNIVQQFNGLLRSKQFTHVWRKHQRDRSSDSTGWRDRDADRL